MASKRMRRKSKEAAEIDFTTFLNLMVVLVPFLLATAVFSRITILELNLPTNAGSGTPDRIKLSVEVIVRSDRLELGDGAKTVARIPNEEEGVYRFDELQALLLEVKGNYPEKDDATVMMEPDLNYDVLVQAMDAVRSITVVQEGQTEPQKVALFPEISIGDAP